MDMQKALEIAKKMIDAVTAKEITVGKAIGYNPTDEPSQGGIIGAITVRGGKILSEEMCIAQLQGEMYRIVYRTSAGDDRVAYINSGRVDVDSFFEESLVFNLQDDPLEGVVALFEEARKQSRDNHERTMKILDELDKEVPPSFRRLIFSKKSQLVAVNIYRANGELSQAVFEPFRGTLAYPKSDDDAKRYFGKQPEWLQHRDTLEAYMLVGQLVADGLLK